MSDLISRKETYNELIESIDWLRERDYELYCVIGDSIRVCLDEQPTAYDIDKVVATMDEALIKLEDGTNCGACVFKDVCDDGYDGCVQTIVAVCKSIVKKGGISDDVCEWKVFDNSLTDEPQWVYGTTCGKYVEEEHTSKAFAYCPYCGKKIKVVR